MACRPPLACVMIVVLGTLVAQGCYKEPTRSKAPDSSSVHNMDAVECRLRLGPVNLRVSAELLIDDPVRIRELVLDPISRAERDTNPANYVYLGNLVLRKADGSEICYVLFDPWGHFGTADEYFITDLGNLHVAFITALDGSRACLDQADLSESSNRR